MLRSFMALLIRSDPNLDTPPPPGSNQAQQGRSNFLCPVFRGENVVEPTSDQRVSWASGIFYAFNHVVTRLRSMFDPILDTDDARGCALTHRVLLHSPGPCSNTRAPRSCPRDRGPITRTSSACAQVRPGSSSFIGPGREPVQVTGLEQPSPAQLTMAEH